jgi:hypothetical protein
LRNDFLITPRTSEALRPDGTDDDLNRHRSVDAQVGPGPMKLYAVSLHAGGEAAALTPWTKTLLALAEPLAAATGEAVSATARTANKAATRIALPS